MYTLRLATALLVDLDVDPPVPVVATTRLGDWDVVPLEAAGRSLLVCVSDRTDLTIVVPRPDLGDLPEALGIALVPVLRTLRVDDAAIAAELDEMSTGTFGSLTDRSRARRVRTLARRAEVWLERSSRDAVDVAGLHLALASARRGRQSGSIADHTRAAFGVTPSSR